MNNDANERFHQLEHRRKWLTLKKATGIATPEELAELEQMPGVVFTTGGIIIITGPMLTEDEWEERARRRQLPEDEASENADAERK